MEQGRGAADERLRTLGEWDFGESLGIVRDGLEALNGVGELYTKRQLLGVDDDTTVSPEIPRFLDFRSP